MADKKPKKIPFNARNVVIFVILIAIVVGYYISTSQKASGIGKAKDEYTLLVEKDLEYGYPATPKEVVKCYARYVKCLYKGGLNDTQVEKLVKQLRILFDDELLAKNTLDSQLELLKRDIEDFKTEKKSITTYEVDEDSIQMGIVDGAEKATIIMGFSVKEDSTYVRTSEQFLLQKDKENKWKIVGWQLVKTDTDDKSTKD